MKIPTYEEFLKDNGLNRDELSEQYYKELLSKIIRVALDNMMVAVHQNQKECSLEQMYNLASMFYGLNSFFFIPQNKQVEE